MDQAMIVQSSTHGFDHSYVQKAMDEFPERFLGCLLANPDEVSPPFIPASKSVILEWKWSSGNGEIGQR